MRIAIGCDHRGLDIKRLVIKLVTGSGYSYEDFGCYTADPVDYPDIAKVVAEGVARGDFEFGVLICNTGIGMSIAANKVKGIRAALCRDALSAGRARRHNDANILCLAAVSGPEAVGDIVGAFFTSHFEGGRHQIRLDKLRAMEG